MKLLSIRESLIRGHLNAGECRARELASEAASLILDAETGLERVLPAAQELADEAARAHAAYGHFAAAVRTFAAAREAPGRRGPKR